MTFFNLLIDCLLVEYGAVVVVVGGSSSSECLFIPAADVVIMHHDKFRQHHTCYGKKKKKKAKSLLTARCPVLFALLCDVSGSSLPFCPCHSLMILPLLLAEEEAWRRFTANAWQTVQGEGGGGGGGHGVYST